MIGLKIDEMEQATKLNSMQLFMVKIFDKQLISAQETEIKQLLSDYFAKEIDTKWMKSVLKKACHKKIWTMRCYRTDEPNTEISNNDPGYRYQLPDGKYTPAFRHEWLFVMP